MMALLFDLLLMPICAVVTGVLVWLLSGGDEQDDQKLFRHFVLIMGVCLLTAWKTSQTDAVRMVLDPQFRLQKELDAQPVYATFKTFAPDSLKSLDEFVVQRMAEGNSMPDAFLLARSLLTSMTNDRMGFADQKTRIAWGRVTADSLRELKASDPGQCYRALSGQLLDDQTLLHGFSAGNSDAFVRAVVAVFESADRGMRDERTPGDIPVDFNTAAREYRVIMEAVKAQFSEQVERQLEKKTFPAQPAGPAEELCSARIVQLESMLERPQGMAAMLIDSVLR